MAATARIIWDMVFMDFGIFTVNVRNCFEIFPKKFRIPPGQNSLLSEEASRFPSMDMSSGYEPFFFVTAALPGVLAEFAQLSKYLVNPGISSTSFTTADGLYVWSKIVDNRRMIIMINESPDDFEGEVDLSELYIPDRILGVYNEDGRKIRMEGNIMKDTFRSNETHVYFVE